MCLALAVTACNAGYYYKDYTPVRASSAANKDALYAAAVSGMSDAGLTIETNDATAGIVVSQWECVDAVTNCTDGGSRYRIRVTVLDGQYAVEVLCQRQEPKVVTANPWEDCTSEPKRPQIYIDKQAAVVAAMERAIGAQ